MFSNKSYHCFLDKQSQQAPTSNTKLSQPELLPYGEIAISISSWDLWQQVEELLVCGWGTNKIYVRPIFIGGALFRFIYNAFGAEVRAGVLYLVNDHKLCMRKAGYGIVHTIRTIVNRCRISKEIILLLEFSNAFNTLYYKLVAAADGCSPSKTYEFNRLAP